ncbi:putative ferric-chelate reductase 1 isoform X2 [Sander lucioperca]|uniref:putative ferric-chelate reductase 1 isoform X2 n=1 Tax=Sander lucioperca TaxID=283035 RepID=UPI0016535680|nr:putative ferric-chelate reductase 1 isoform X2 [Sander lucioperca]
MDNRLFLTVLVVTLSWISLGTYAQTTAAVNVTTAAVNMTTAADNNVTTAAGNNVTTAAGNNVTTAAGNNGTTGAGNNVTTAAGNNVTTAAGNNVTTAAGNNVTTAAGNNVTTAAGNNVTTAAGNNVTTAAPPLTPNTTVENLETPLSRTQCGKTQLCAATPSQCDPSTSGSCFFLAVRQTSGNNFEFGLSGESDGYIAASLSSTSTQGGNDITYVCANNKGVVKFFGALLNNGRLTVTTLNVNSVKGSINGTKIQCTFAATVPTPSTRAPSLAIAISTGSFNSTSGDLGAPNTRFSSSPVDLANPNATVTNNLSVNTTTLQQSVMQAMLITVAVLGLAML